MKATITTLGNMVFLNFFNSKEIYSVKGFDTVRKAKNYAKKYGYTVHLVLVDTPVEQAIAQVRKRYREGGHDVSLEKIVESNKKARENFNLLKPLVDSATVV